MTKIERQEIDSAPGYAQLWHHKGKIVLIMGNSVQERKDGTRWLWAANWNTGERINTPVTELEPYEGSKPSMLEVVHQVERWAHEGNGDAMWWLGDFYEFGSRVTGANGGKALAYYLGAIRCEPEWYERDTVDRVLQDGMDLFRAGHPEGVEDKTPTDTRAFLAKFREFRAIDTERKIYYPDTEDWLECIAIAEALQ
jgi:hypothetical protein